KLFGHETNDSIMMFEETVPVGTKSLFHLHRDSDEVAWVLAGEITFKIGDEVSVGGPGTCAFFPRNVPHAWKSTGSETGRVLFLYTPAAAGGYVEALSWSGPARRDVGQGMSVVIELQQPAGLHHVRREEEGRAGIARQAPDPPDRGRHLWRHLFR